VAFQKRNNEDDGREVLGKEVALIGYSKINGRNGKIKRDTHEIS
jgi:hypothetical protein